VSRYKALRTWAFALMVLGVLSIVSASVGVVSLAIAADGVWDTLGVVFIGGPIVLFIATWPFAAGEALRSLADIGDAIAPEGSVF
jgi:hypothetical protein